MRDTEPPEILKPEAIIVSYLENEVRRETITVGKSLTAYTKSRAEISILDLNLPRGLTLTPSHTTEKWTITHPHLMLIQQVKTIGI